MDTISTLLLTGENNHDWRTSSPFLAKLLEESGRFNVTIAEDAGAALEDATALSAYELIFSDYNGPDWSEQACTNFENAIAGGAGLVIFHAANNCFNGWTAFEKMCGLKWVAEKGSSHGDFVDFKVEIKNPDHPITAGMQDFDHIDELYNGTINPHGVDVDVLATAFSNESEGGSGKDEPVLVALPYGEGRVFHNLLGHVWPGDPWPGYRGCSLVAFETPGFQKTLMRGCEWAATGTATL
jgi:type 1 glutamine amidotransferase